MSNCPTKTDFIKLRITPAEKRALMDASRQRGIALSELIRQYAFEAVRQAVA